MAGPSCSVRVTSPVHGVNFAVSSAGTHSRQQHGFTRHNHSTRHSHGKFSTAVVTVAAWVGTKPKRSGFLRHGRSFTAPRACLVDERELETDAAARMARSMGILDNISEEAHPGHRPGRFAGPGPEYDGMIHDPTTGRWRLACREENGGNIESTALARLTEADRVLVTTFEAEGGLCLTLSNAFKRADRLRAAARKLAGDDATGDIGDLDSGQIDEEASLADLAEALQTTGLEVGMDVLKGSPAAERAKLMLQAAELVEEREAVMRNVWSDIEFHGGEGSNAELVSQLEAQFASQLVRTAEERVIRKDDAHDAAKVAHDGETAGEPLGQAAPSHAKQSNFTRQGDDGIFDLALRNCSNAAELAQRLPEDELTATLMQSRNLGVALDLVGVYLKNYEIDKAGLVIDRIVPLCRERGGVWLVKGLDKLSAVRMKQFRADEALTALKEIEQVVPFSPAEGWEFHDILYRNFAWCYSALGGSEKCLEYTRKSVEVKRDCGIPASWFDLWDMGKAHAQVGQKTGEREEMRVAYDLVCRAAELHRKAEPSDRIMLAKILSNVGEVAMAIGDSYQAANTTNDEQEFQRWYADALPALRESYELHVLSHGPMKPLSGWAAGTVAHCMVRLQRWDGAQEYLAMALKVECTKDSTTPGSLIELIDRISSVHEVLRDYHRMAAYFADLEHGITSLRNRGWDRRERDVFALLLQKVSGVFLLGHDGTGNTATRALKILQEAETNLAIHLGGSVKACRCRACGKICSNQEELDAHIEQHHFGEVLPSEDISDPETMHFGPRPKDLHELLSQIRASIRMVERGSTAALSQQQVPSSISPSADHASSLPGCEDTGQASVTEVEEALPVPGLPVDGIASTETLGVYQLRRNSPPFCTQLRYEPTMSRDVRLFLPHVLVGDGQMVTLLSVDDSREFGYVRYMQDEGWVQLRYLFDGTGDVTNPYNSIAYTQALQ